MSTLVIAQGVLAGDPLGVRFRTLSTEEGLSQAFIYAMAQDPQGYMWFGTQEGLNRYDGHEFTIFAHDPTDPNSIVDGSIRAIEVDRQGQLWIATDGGLARYDTTKRHFINYRHDSLTPDSLAGNRVRVLFADRNGTLWVGTDRAGLDRFEPDTGRFTHFPHDADNPAGLIGESVWTIEQRRDGSLWIGTNRGLSKMNADGKTFTHFTHDPLDPSSLSDNWIRSVFEDRQGTLWVGTDTGGLHRLTPDENVFVRYQNDKSDATSLSSDNVTSILEDHTGTLWIGTADGLNAWNPDSETFTSFYHHASDRYSLVHNSVLSLFEDRGNVLWVGTHNGLSHWSQATRAILHYRSHEKDPSSLSNNIVTAFAEDVNGDILVGTFGGGLNVLDPKEQQFRVLRHDPNDAASLPDDRVMALHVDQQGVLWAGTRASGLARREPGSDTFLRLRHDPKDASSLSMDGVSAIMEQRDGRVWIATFGGGLNLYRGDTQSFQHYRHDPDDSRSIGSDRLMTLFEDSDRVVWIGTYDAGLNRFDPTTGQFDRIRNRPEQPKGLGGDEIYMIREDARKDLWIAIKGVGLHRWRYTNRVSGTPIFERFAENNGLPIATVYSGEWDGTGRLWLGTGRGLSRFDVESQQFKNYTAGHGLQSGEFNFGASLRAADGTLYFGGGNGFNAFQPDDLVPNGEPPTPAVTRFLSMNEPQAVDGTGAASLSLDHKQRMLTFEYAALDFAAPEHNRYMYKLDGLEDDWIDAGKNRQVTYTNLKPGDYAFHVRASNNDGVWSEQPASIAFSLHPAPWHTAWAYAAYLLSATLLIAYGWHLRQRRAAVERAYTENLQRVEARLSEAQRIGSVGNWDWDVAANTLWWSDQAHRLFGVDVGKLVGNYESLVECVHPEDRAAFKAAMRVAIQGEQSLSIDHRIQRADGSVRVIHQRAEVSFDRSGKAVRVAGTAHDITDRKRAEDDIRHRANFQTLLAELSAQLIRAQADDLAEHLRAGLSLVGEKYNLDDVSVQWSADDGRASVYQWPASSSSPPAMCLADYPWLIAKVQSGKVVCLMNIDQLPPDAAIDRHSMTQHGREATLAIPLPLEGDAAGFIAFCDCSAPRNWTEQTVSELRLVAENIAIAIARSRAVAEVRRLKNRLLEENLFLREEVRLAHGFDEIVGENDKLRSCLQAVEKVAPTDVPVLILGETGTGKELIARAVYELSERHDGPLVSVNCPALPGNLIESELFGHEKGAFTGALSQRKGRFELADGGTLFLDEIGDLPLELQAKLLRVLQTGQFERLGGTETLFANVRLIAATNHDLAKAVEDGSFRADLLYRIQTFPIHLPALRDRKDDISPLAKHFVHKHATRLGKHFDTISVNMLRALEDYDWPGNVRELESVIERAIISTESGAPLRLSTPLTVPAVPQLTIDEPRKPGADMQIFERAHIVKVLEKTNWKISGNDSASALLGIPASTLRSKMKRHGIRRHPN